MPRPSKTAQEVGYLKDYWEEVRTMEADHHGMFELYIRPSNRPGVMIHRMVFTPLMQGLPDNIGKQTIEFTYPNAEQSTYSGFLWRKAIALSRQVQGAWDERRNRLNKGG